MASSQKGYKCLQCCCVRLTPPQQIISCLLSFYTLARVQGRHLYHPVREPPSAKGEDLWGLARFVKRRLPPGGSRQQWYSRDPLSGAETKSPQWSHRINLCVFHQNGAVWRELLRVSVSLRLMKMHQRRRVAPLSLFTCLVLSRGT